jgi:hypothetical protein
MAETAHDRLHAIMPAAFVQALGRAAQGEQMPMVLVIDAYILDELQANRPAMIEMDDGGIVVLIPQDRVTKAYEG